MDPTIAGAIIGAGATILIFLLERIPGEKVLSSLSRKRQNIPNIVGTTWKATWYGDGDSIYVVDTIEFKKWTRKNRFIGTGDMTEDLDGLPNRFIYPFEGEITGARTVVLTYRAAHFPTESLIGSACMELNDSANELKGWWVGRRKVKNVSGEIEWKLLPGLVKMKRINK
jgi:hypothetical protein